MLPILIQIGSFKIAAYGFLVAAAYLTGIVWLKSRMKLMGLSERRFWGLVYSLFFGAILGGKLLYVILEWDLYASGQMGIIRDFRYGFVFYGGFLGAVTSGALFMHYHDLPFWKLADYFGVALPLGHWLGRLGCLAAGCCYGRPTDVPWAVKFSNPASLVPPHLLGTPLHPTQVYESLGDIAIAAVLYRTLLRVQAGRLRRGTVFLSYILLYAALRFFVEMYRSDDRGGFWSGLSVSQWAALASFAAGGFLLAMNGLRDGT